MDAWLSFKDMKDKIKYCIEMAKIGASKLTDDILAIEGMSSASNRHLLNNLGAMFDRFNYLEIGVHKGSTYVSSLYRNNVVKAWAIDDWSQFQDQSAVFMANCERFGVPVELINANCFTIDTSPIKDINFYFYDGHHGFIETAMGLTCFYDSLAKEFLYIVDDYDWDDVERGTEEAIKFLGLSVEYSIHLESTSCNENKSWWNGLGVFVLRKK